MLIVLKSELTPQISEGKFVIEKKISENAYQNQTQIGMGEASCENWPHTKVRVNWS